MDFEPATWSTDDYGVGMPQGTYLDAPDGAAMYVEVSKPVRGPKGIDPPDRSPVILVMTPYEGTFPAAVDDANPQEDLNPGQPPDSPYHDRFRDFFVPKGYAFALAHIYGTGNSEGCLEMYGRKEIAAASAVVEELGSAPWSTGRVGMLGTSYDGGEALRVAALGSAGARQHLAAVVSDAGWLSWGEVWGFDGVPIPGAALLGAGLHAGVAQSPAPLSPPASEGLDPIGAAERAAGACRAENAKAAAEYELTGDLSSWMLERSGRSGARAVTAATLMFQGFHDANLAASAPVGFFDLIPSETPHKLVLGQWGHAATVRFRKDRMAMLQSWFDRFLSGHPTGAEGWPAVQVQDSAGRWRIEPDWPSTGGPVGQLALGRDLELGTAEPVGSTAYVELPRPTTNEPTEVVFSSRSLASPLHIVGQPVLDLWLELDRDDAHIAAVFKAFDRDGGQIAGNSQAVVAYRSARHLEPIRDGEFRQDEGHSPIVNRPIRVPVRFYIPVDVLVPTGGWITIRIAGTSLPDYPSSVSGSDTRVKLLHDCEHVSALRFLMPRAKPKFLSVSMTDEQQTQVFPVPEEAGGVADGGLARQPVCGQEPLHPAAVVS